MATVTYNAKLIDVSYGPLAVSSGFTDGGKVSVAMSEDHNTITKGTHDETTFSVMNNSSAEITIPLMAGSAMHREMLSLYTAARLAPSGLILLPLIILDRVNDIKMFAPETAIKKLPDMEYGREVGEREWTLHTGNMIVTPI